ncbi:MAG: tetratricopeptide repeat protein [Longimicrobiales bacterium]|nr:tetratricopeptide repeat protein [Longimicrobiales bacterium]
MSDRADAGERPREDEFTRAAQDYLDDGFAQEALGQTAAADAALQNAVGQAQRAVETDPTNPRAHLLLGEALISRGEYQAGAEAYRRALELRPAYFEETRAQREEAWVDLYNEGVPLLNAGDFGQAIAVFSAADAIYEERPEIKIILGQLLVQEGEYERAVEVLREAEEVIAGPRIEEVDSATAAAWIEQSEDIDPALAQSFLMLDRPADAVPVLESLRQTYPDQISYVRTLAQAYQDLGRTDEARALYNELAERNDLSPGDYMSLGIGLYQMEEYLEASVPFIKAAEVAPYDRDALELGVNSLQLTYLGNDSLTASPEEIAAWVDMADRWIELDPNNPQAYTALAQGLARQGDESRTPALLNTAQGLDVHVRNLQMMRINGGANVVGAVSRASDDAPDTVEIVFTFYDLSGNALGTEVATVQLPAGVGNSTGLNITYQGGAVEGYGYEVRN